MHSQVVVLGGGPGGYAAAFLAADLGLEVTLVEAEPRLGGTCLLRGCIPSKALLHVAKVIGEAARDGRMGRRVRASPRSTIDKVRARKEKVIATLTGGLEQLAKRRKVRVINARGIFDDSQTLQLEGGDTSHLRRASGSRSSIASWPPARCRRCRRCSRSTRRPRDGFDRRAGTDRRARVAAGRSAAATSAWKWARSTPSLARKVTVVELTDGLLPGADRDLVKPLHKRLREALRRRSI